MATRTTKRVTMCAVSIDYATYLLPADKGMRLVDLMKDAVKCRDGFPGARSYCVSGDQPELSMAIIKPSQLRQVSSKNDEDGMADEMDGRP